MPKDKRLDVLLENLQQQGTLSLYCSHHKRDMEITGKAECAIKQGKKPLCCGNILKCELED